jgi:hypothetical protein
MKPTAFGVRKEGGGGLAPAVTVASLLIVAGSALLAADEGLRGRLSILFGGWPAKPLTPSGPPVRGGVSDTELQCLQALASGGRVLEFGTAYGYTAIGMALVARQVVTDDPGFSPADADALEQNLAAYGVMDRVTIVQETSAVFCLAGDGGFNLCFVDGDHSETQAGDDCECGWASLGPGGALCVHDYTTAYFGGNRPPVSVDSDHLFRRNPTRHFG